MKNILFGFISFLLFLSLASCQSNEEIKSSFEPTNIESLSTPEILAKTSKQKDNVSFYQEDAEELIELLETRHIMFALNRVPEDYEKEKEIFLESLPEEMDNLRFSFLAAKFITSLNDGHTMLYHSYGLVLQIEWRWNNNRLIVLSGGIPEKAEIVKIGGVSIAEIAEEALKYRACENVSAEEMQIEFFARSRDSLEFLGAEINGNNVDVEYMLNGVPAIETMQFTVLESNGNTNGKTAEYEIKNNVFIMTMYRCTVNKEWESSVNAMKEAVSAGINTIVIDIRGNPGGHSPASTGILDALGMEYGYGEVDVYYNEDTYKIYNGEVDDIGTVKHFNGVMRHANPENIMLFILVDRGTFSAAVELAVKTQDSTLGTIIGEIPSNSPSCYGSCQQYKLSNSKLSFQLSSKWINRVDKERPNNALIPDVLLSPEEDALDYFWENIYPNL